MTSLNSLGHFLSHQNVILCDFKKFENVIQNEKDLKIRFTRSDHGVSSKMKALRYS